MGVRGLDLREQRRERVVGAAAQLEHPIPDRGVDPQVTLASERERVNLTGHAARPRALVSPPLAAPAWRPQPGRAPPPPAGRPRPLPTDTPTATASAASTIRDAAHRLAFTVRARAPRPALAELLGSQRRPPRSWFHAEPPAFSPCGPCSVGRAWARRICLRK